MKKDHIGLGKGLIESKALPTFQDLWQHKYVPYTVVAKALNIGPPKFKAYIEKPSTLTPEIITQIAKYFGAKKQPLQELIKAGILREKNEENSK